MEQWLYNNLGSDASALSGWMRLAIVAGIIIAAYLVDLLFTKLVTPLLQKIARRTTTQWDDILLSPAVCRSFAHILPPVILASALPFAMQGMLEEVVTRLMRMYIIYNVCYFVTTLMHAIFNIFMHEKHAKASSLKGILQTLQILVWIVSIILMISVLMDRSPLLLITGLGAAATVLMLVFQDSIKGLVAGVQLSMNDMVRVGDWICMPSRDVDGVVTEISLSTVKVRNWDNTILTIQPYALLTDTFQNWRGMSESDGRRFTRSVNVNMNSLRLLNAREVHQYQAQGWLPAAAQAGEATNLEAYRGCLYAYLCKHPEVNSQMTCMVRQLQASSEGIPVQVYAFSYTKVWEEYESLQSRIVEYMLALMPRFDISPYQRSSDKRES